MASGNGPKPRNGGPIGPDRGTPYAPHDHVEVEAMLDAIDAEAVETLFDIPEGIRYDDTFGIEARGERAVRDEVRRVLARNDDLVEFLGRGHYDHYVPSVVDHLADRSEFLTSYTQYQPEIAQGFLQALFEYQSLLVELTGLSVANCSMYDAATALGEAALLADRVRDADGDRVLVPRELRSERRSVLTNYAHGADLTIDTYTHDDGIADLGDLEATIDDDVAFVYAESPTTRGTIEESLAEIGGLAHDHDALFGVGSDPIALALLEAPAEAGADVVVGDASVLGLPMSYGTGLGLFATREQFLRQVPGRLVGAGPDAANRRAYTLTLQTREQHIRRERATSNICTNQAWIALRVAIHAAALGPGGLLDLAERCVELPRDLAGRLDDIQGVRAPVHDRPHFREFVAGVDQPARAVRDELLEAGVAVHAIGDHKIQVCVTERTADRTDRLVGALRGVFT